jgi:ATP-dependent Lon protease
VVVFPHMVIPLFVGRDKSIRALDIAMEATSASCWSRRSSRDRRSRRDRPVSDRHAGAGAAIAEAARRHDQGAGRRPGARRVDGVREEDGALSGNADAVDSAETREPREVEAIARSLMSMFEQYIKTNRKLPPELMQTLAGIDDPSRLADTIAAHLGVR